MCGEDPAELGAIWLILWSKENERVGSGGVEAVNN